MQNERKVLISALLKAEKSGYSNIVLDSVLNSSDLNDVGKGFVTTAFYGVLERKYSIDYVLNKFLKKPISKTPPYTSAVLRSAAYQIIFMDKIPNSAAVNEGVKLIKKSKEQGNVALVNAVLRKIASEDLKNAVLSSSDVSVRYSVNGWIYDRLVSENPKEKVNAFLENSFLAPPIFIRINTLKNNAFQTVFEEFQKMDITLKHTELSDFFMVDGIKNVEKMESFKKGLFFVQDYSSRLASLALSAKSGDRVLDCCAAPGGKSFSIALDMKNEGEIYSLDIHKHRVKLINEGAERLGLTSINAFENDASVFNEKLGIFDKVICDVPCSGIGVIRRKPEIKYKEQAECDALPDIQIRILQTASKYLKSGGRLVYSTCTLLKSENQEVVNLFLSKNKDFKLVTPFNLEKPEYITLMPPENLGDGFFIAVMERS